MALSRDLVSQFAKALNVKQPKSDTNWYGTVVAQNGSLYVKIDGSAVLTPMLTTADVQAGERVTVLIKNHMAIVTGNFSSPAARAGSVSDLETSTADQMADLNEKIDSAVKVESLTNLEIEALLNSAT